MPVARQRIHLPPRSWRLALRGELREGDVTPRFERAFADAMGVPEAVAVASGRAGLRFLFDALELPAGSEVICSAFGYPVVPKGQARIRVQMSAAHEIEHLDRAVDAFTAVGKELGVLS